MNNQFSIVRVGLLIIGFSQAIGWLLNLIVGVSYSGFVLVSSEIVIIDSLALGFTVFISLYFTRLLAERSERVFPVLLLSFGLLLGTGIITGIAFLIANPASFLYPGSRTITYLLINLLFFVSLNVIVNGFSLFQHRILARETALSEEKRLKTQMELNLLASKINPHFLFNSLNLLVSLLKDPVRAETALINLSEFLRYQLDYSEVETVDLEQELTIVEKYLALQKMRFGERLDYELSGSVEARIPPMVLQPLVENSIKHNLDRVERLTIRININKDKERVHLSIVDSEASIVPGMLEKGVGLTVTKKRIEHFGGQFLIENGGINIYLEP